MVLSGVGWCWVVISGVGLGMVFEVLGSRSYLVVLHLGGVVG